MALLLVAPGASCGGDDGGPGHTSEPPEPLATTGPASTETSTTAAGSEETGELSCGPDQPCPDGRFCAGPHRAGLLSPPDAFVCMSDCVPAGSTTYWCLDDSSCCGDARCDADFGLCESDASTTTTGTDSGSTDTSGTGTDTETGTTDTGGTTTDATTQSTGSLEGTTMASTE